MKKLLGFVAFVLIAQGAGGIAHMFIGWFDKWALVDHLAFLDGYEIYVCVLLIALGLAVGAASDAVGRHE
ncbi:hypothetical protein MMF93_22605 [Streptomyces tubbatahanensis]|uniref:Uncharacterized protein n=1 Tax=Streptomyces tubbatahanensis TaxID=2923272 RepID=A0ABY3XWP7_9ACTN|nr:hypothetical protein [Streptomyces tubbatahanensis]UNS98939.1 hypothetical protein MMF93_22605 [Streptomyces tubbatahanensis]